MVFEGGIGIRIMKLSSRMTLGQFRRSDGYGVLHVQLIIDY